MRSSIAPAEDGNQSTTGLSQQLVTTILLRTFLVGSWEDSAFPEQNQWSRFFTEL